MKNQQQKVGGFSDKDGEKCGFYQVVGLGIVPRDTGMNLWNFSGFCTCRWGETWIEAASNSGFDPKN